MSSEVILKIENLSKIFRMAVRPSSKLLNALFPYHSRTRSFTALKNFSLTVQRGECIGVLGVNGSGKSTLLQLIAGILSPSSGRILACGKIAALLELGSWIDMTDTGRENIYNAGYIFGLSKTEIEQQIPDIIDFAEIGDFIDQPVSTYSTGMLMRLAFSSCIYLESDILLLDEIFAVGDAHFSQKCIELLRQRINRTTVILVSHDTNIINSLCTRAILLHHGEMVQIGAPRLITERYLEICYSEKQKTQINSGEIATSESEDFRASSRVPEISVCPFSHDGRSFGEGQAQICDVALLSPNGQPLTLLKGGENVILRLRAQINADLVHPSLGFVVISPDGLQLWGDSAYPGEELPEIAAGKVFEASFQFVLPLLPQGTYTIGAAISSGSPLEHHVQEWCHRALTFSVKADLPIHGILFSPPVKNIQYRILADDDNDTNNLEKNFSATAEVQPSEPTPSEEMSALKSYCQYLEQQQNELKNKIAQNQHRLNEHWQEKQELLKKINCIQHELKDYFQENIKFREKYFSLRRNYVQKIKENNNLSQAYESMQWQTDFNRKYLAEIKNSRAWFIARRIHFLYGFLFFRREIIQEAREAWTNLVMSEQNSQSKRHQLIFLLNYFGKNIYHLFKPRPLEMSTIISDNRDKRGAGIPVYDSNYQEEEIFDLSNQEVKTIAFYLPQYHTFPENDLWWGKGFTEWTNTSKAHPRFPQHYQPRVPHQDIGYYDLSNVATLRQQAELAKRHGINAFCFYYYWFDGKKLMEKPLDLLIANPDIDLPFCLCWANENWTRTWDGQEKSVLIEQNYSSENDVNFIRDLAPYLRDPRYLRCAGKPVILVYHVKILPDPDRTFAMWRKYCRENGIGEIQIWSCRTFIQSNKFKKSVEVDREVEFPPHMIASIKKFAPEKFKAYDNSGNFYDYSAIIKDVMTEHTLADRADYPIYRCAMLGWDNSCRRATGWSIWQYFSLKSYHTWLRKIIDYTKKKFPVDERFIFVNAWNEWAEGTYLEPDEKYGYAGINTTTRALCNLPPLPDYQRLSPQPITEFNPGTILLHLHCFYVDLLEEFVNSFNQMPFPYDCIITTDSDAKKQEISQYLELHPLSNCQKHQVVVTSNRGRDVAPFFESCRKIVNNYDFIGHFHTKRSLTVDWGNEWRHYLLHNLLGSREIVQSIFRRFARDARLGIYFPTTFPPMKNYLNWEKNRPRIERMLAKMGYRLPLPENPEFPVGQMFWARTAAVQAIFEPDIINLKDFEPEKNQISNTLSHVIERIWSYVAQGANYTTLTGVFPGNFAAQFTASELAEVKAVKRLALFVHHQKDGQVSDADCYLLQQLQSCADIVFISNGNLNPAARQKLKPLISQLLERNNEGYDFGAWRDALAQIDLTGYQELILLNNSILGPFVPFANIFAKMARSKVDFWGLSRFPRTCNSLREEAQLLPDKIIPRHIQSFFTVYTRPVFTSEVFQNFWKNVQNETNLPAVVAHYETQLSNVLERANFKSEVYLQAAERFQEYNTTDPSFNAIYCHPQDFLVLNFPFLKKNICYYMKQPEINETIQMIGQFSDYPIKFIHITEKTR